MHPRPSLPAEAVRFWHCFGLDGINRALVLAMQEERKARADCFSFRRHCGLKEIVLNLLWQTAPTLGNSLPQCPRHWSIMR
jgi:hypothetical protein